MWRRGGVCHTPTICPSSYLFSLPTLSSLFHFKEYHPLPGYRDPRQRLVSHYPGSVCVSAEGGDVGVGVWLCICESVFSPVYTTVYITITSQPSIMEPVLKWNSWTSTWQKTQVFTFTGGFTENHTLLWFLKIHLKKSAKQENSCLFMHSFCRTERWGKKIRQKNSSQRGHKYMPRTLE